MNQAILKKIRKQLAAENEPERKLPLVPAKKTWVEVKAVLQKYPGGCLVERKHPFLQTQFILDGSDDCLLISFDGNGKYAGTKAFRNKTAAPFSYLISDPYVVVVPDGEGLLPEKTAK